MSAPDIVSSQITKSQRWNKLYRIIHNLFLSKEFIHKKDYEQTINGLNARIAAVEANAGAALTAATSGLSAMVMAHTHTVATVGSPSAQTGVTTGIIAAAPQLPPTPAAPSAIIQEIFMQQEVARLMAEGPALAPLSGGASADQVIADSTVRSDILSSEV